MESEDIKKRLDQIAFEIKSGKNWADYKLEIDKLLGTELPDRDEEAEAEFENKRHLDE